MCWLRRWWILRRAAKAVRAAEKVVAESRDDDEATFESVSLPLPNPGTEEQYSVTGHYEIVSKHVANAVEEERKKRSAARRLMDAIGVVPSSTKK